MARFRKKPVVIEAVEWTGTNVDEIAAFVSSYADFLRTDCVGPNGGVMPGGALIIPTLEGDHTASPGDWIVKGVKNEFYPVKPDIFALTYEPE